MRGAREILLRVASAAVLAPLGLYAVHLGGWPLAILTALAAALASGEWVRMASGMSGTTLLVAYLITGGGAIGAVVAPLLVPGSGLELVALVSLVSALGAGLLALATSKSITSMAFGAVYTSFPFGAFVWIRESGDDGRMYLFALLVIVWTTDIAAYFAGRGFGGPLLSPKDSPNKTWNGAIGALVCAGLAGAAVARAAGGNFSHWLAASAILSIVAMAGDLLESRFKRLYGVKDTSGLVPGHGGVLDRLDALMLATVLAAMVIRFLPGLAPAFGD